MLQFHTWQFFFSLAMPFHYSLLQALLMNLLQAQILLTWHASGPVLLQASHSDSLTTHVAKVDLAGITLDVVSTRYFQGFNLAPLVGASSDQWKCHALLDHFSLFWLTHHVPLITEQRSVVLVLAQAADLLGITFWVLIKYYYESSPIYQFTNSPVELYRTS